jgi:hypothetical protein
VVPLLSNEYLALIAQMVALNLPGSGIFDALIAQAALKVDAGILLTLNPKHFTRLGEVIANLVQVPELSINGYSFREMRAIALVHPCGFLERSPVLSVLR